MSLADKGGDAPLGLGQGSPPGRRRRGRSRPFGAAGAGLPHSALHVAAEGPGSHVVVLVPGPVELRKRFGAAVGGEEGASVGFGADGAQDWPWAAVENVYGLGQDVEVLFPQSAQVESDAFEARHAWVTGRVRLGDIEAGGSERVIPGGDADLKEQPVPARPQRPVAAGLFCTLQDRPQSVPCCGQIAAAGGEPAAHNGDARVTDGLVGVGDLVGEPQLGRGDLSLAAQQRDRRTDRDRVEKVQVGAQFAAELDQGAAPASASSRRPRLKSCHICAHVMPGSKASVVAAQLARA